MTTVNYDIIPEDSLQLAMSLIEEFDFSDKDLAKLEAEAASLQDQSQYTVLDLIYYGEPKAQARARHSTLGNFFYDPSSSLKAWLVEQITTQLPKNFRLVEGDIEMRCVFYKGMPKSLPKKTKVLMELGLIKPTSKPDVDNYIKLVQDALNKVLYSDDSQIVCLHAEKFFSVKPRAKIQLKFKMKP
jgi:Holliday junction resolvase RusA-like endonuclease